MQIDTKEKHLEFIQNNIDRMNKCSFQMKGWAITFVTALLALYAASMNGTSHGIILFVYIAIAPTFICWMLDSYYLSLERKFIAMYNDVAGITKKCKFKSYEINIRKYKGWKNCMFRAIFSFTNVMMYLSIIIGLICFGILM